MSNYYSDDINNALNEIYASINTISERFNNSVTLNNQYMEQIQQIQNKLNIITQNEQNNSIQQQTANQLNNVTPSVETSLPENKDQTQFPDIPSPPVAQPFYQQQNQVSLLNNNVQPLVRDNLLPITNQQQPQNQVSLLNNIGQQVVPNNLLQINNQPQDQYQYNPLQINNQPQPQDQYNPLQITNQPQDQYPTMTSIDGGYARKQSSKKKRRSFKQKTVKCRTTKKGARKHS
jgi:hypothetical protein